MENHMQANLWAPGAHFSDRPAYQHRGQHTFKAASPTLHRLYLQFFPFAYARA